MTQAGFYHLTQSSLEEVLPKLLVKVLDARKRAIIRVGSQERLDFLDKHLWNSGRGSFLPHGTETDGHPKDQPIWLTLGEDNPNKADFLFLVDDTDSQKMDTYERVFDIFNGNDRNSLLKARERWRTRKSQDIEVTYWKQSEEGRWEAGKQSTTTG